MIDKKIYIIVYNMGGNEIINFVLNYTINYNDLY
jgi:hypothetical protein